MIVCNGGHITGQTLLYLVAKTANKPAQPETAAKPAALTPLPLALPAPKIDLAQQTQIITALRKNPSLLFRPEVRSFYNLERMWAFGDAPPVTGNG